MYRHIISVVLLLLFLAGCNLTHGERIDTNKLELLQEGHTTQEQVVEVLGSPYRAYPGPGGKGEIYSYEYYKSTRYPVDVFKNSWDEIQRIECHFDEKGILRQLEVKDDIND